MEPKKKYVKVCLHCGSTNTKIPPAGLDIKMTLPDYCAECGNRGIFPEVEIYKLNEFRKEIRKKEKED